MSCHTNAEMQIKLPVSPSHSMLTLGQPVPAQTLHHQVPARVATRVPTFQPQVRPNLEKAPQGKQDSTPGPQFSRQVPNHKATKTAGLKETCMPGPVCYINSDPCQGSLYLHARLLQRLSLCANYHGSYIFSFNAARMESCCNVPAVAIISTQIQ